MSHVIQLLNTISPKGLQLFPAERYTLGETVENPAAMLLRSCDLQSARLPESLEVVGRAGAGVNNIPVDELTARGIPVLNTPGANANAVKELVLAGLFLASRHLCEAWEYVKNLNLSDEALDPHVEKAKKQFVGSELPGRTLGVIGLGSIGAEVANAAHALGMSVLGYDPSITVERAWKLSANIEEASHLDQLLAHADFITLHVPLNPETESMIGTSALQKIKNTAVLLNFSRDGIVDNMALRHALDTDQLAYYISDFPNNIFKHHPRVLMLPHLGASTVESEENCAVMIARQVMDYLENGTLKNAVNFPAVYMPRTKNTFRLAIVNKNIPNMVAQISTALASHGLNLVDLVNKSRNEIAYTLIDTDQPPSPALMDAIRKIEGVIRLRAL